MPWWNLCFDVPDGWVCQIAGLVNKDAEIGEALETTVLKTLLEVNRQIGVQSQITFETILHIFDYSESLFDMLETVSRINYYDQELIPFRCMRAECIKILWSSALNYSFSTYYRLEKACGAELWNSTRDETDMGVCQAPYQVYSGKNWSYWGNN